ncbi:MAG: MBL fold metallo-hydrolase [Christensenellales bacterium]
MKLAIQPLFSGSSGNSIMIESAHTTLLVDAGMSAAAITKALKVHGKSPEEIDGILLTHEHTDHISGVNQLCKRYGLALYANANTYQGMEAKMQDVPIGQARVFTTGEDFYVQDIAIHAFPIPHDAAEPVGYALYAAGAKVCVATDMGHMTKRILQELEGANALVLESNHDLELLKNGKYPQFLKRRILSNKGHLSNDMAAQAAVALAQTGTRQIILGHLSSENNREPIAERTVCEQLCAQGAVVGSDVCVHVAHKAEGSARIVVE